MQSLVRVLFSTVPTFAVATPVFAGLRHDNRFYDDATVVRAQPITEIVRVETPREECWTEARTRLGYRHRPQTYTPEIVAVIIGAAIANRFGSGRGRDLATATVAVLGESVTM